MLIYFPPLSISPQQSFYCGDAFHLACSSGTKSLSSLMWNKHAKSEQQNQPWGWSLFSGTARHVDLPNIRRPPRWTRKPSPHRDQRYWGSTSAEGTIQAKTSVSQSVSSSSPSSSKPSAMKTSCLLKGPIFPVSSTCLNLGELSAGEKLIWFSSHSAAKQVKNLLWQLL